MLKANHFPEEKSDDNKTNNIDCNTQKMRHKDIDTNIDYNLLNRNDRILIKIIMPEINGHNSSSTPILWRDSLEAF